MYKFTAIMAAAALVACSACSGDDDAGAQKQPRSSVLTSSSAQPSPISGLASQLNHIPGRMPGGTESQTGRDAAPVGGCVNLSGEKINANIKLVPCGGADNNYIVIQRVNFPTDCVADTDRRYYHNGGQGEFTACLDLAWSSDSCISIDNPKVLRTNCQDSSVPNQYRPIKVVLNTENIDGCPDKGFAHPIRRFTICTETQP
ncbi:LppU/SCO3897 family protein [Mycobacteroides salmoniphilum]|uniref:Liporotein LppU n=1 Tax=Mycobacteroides salmoniphilum TaxID=404941 RepID=A0A4V3I0X8_9MYCO|nr:hypothetical protein [Mycobacteroides salmoniphilum]TDZ93380.1 hypothetical protein CCUG62472_02757 [Mycobacteroides salmoniphilum]TEA03997.1 hypothetical protein CCUG60884_02860 [Mycobacteroides salmoniphilum]